jgi:prepilin-type N-terminal cleavage/methylation domain-containing protein
VSLTPLFKRSARGFTLIELLVVIVIIAVLMAIAIPAYITQQQKAKDVAAKSQVSTAFRSLRGAQLSASASLPAQTSLLAEARSDNPQLSFISGLATVNGLSGKVWVSYNTMTVPNLVMLTTVSASGKIVQLSATSKDGWGSPTINVFAASAAGSLASNAEADHSCAVLIGGEVKCWGYNVSGQIGDGNIGTNRPTPLYVLLSGNTQTANHLTGATQVVSGASTSCALLQTTEVMCWGKGVSGERGDGTTSGPIANPVYVLTSGSAQGANHLTGVASLSGGQSYFCALLITHEVKCWGNNANGQTGDGTSTSPRINPVYALSSGSAQGANHLVGVSQMTTGAANSCALLTSGEVQCWGYNGTTNSALGDGTTAVNRLNPVYVLTSGSAQGANHLTGVTQVAAGGLGACAVLASSEAMCWGEDSSGEDGDGLTVGSGRANPVYVLSSGSAQGANHLTGVTQIVGNDASKCALVASNVMCWGDNGNNELGDGTSTMRTNPVYVLTSGSSQAANRLSLVTVLTGGYNHTCGLSAGKPTCWGYNGQGEVGTGATTPSNLPNATAASTF